MLAMMNEKYFINDERILNKIIKECHRNPFLVGAVRLNKTYNKPKINKFRCLYSEIICFNFK